MKTVCGDETTDSKRQFCVPSAGHRGRLLKLVKHRRTRLHYTCWVTLSIWDKVCMLCLIFFPKGDSILFLERPSSRWVVIFRALSKHDPLWMTTLEENMKKLQRNIKWPKNNQEQRHQLCLNHMDTSAFNGKVISYLEPKISHLSNLYTIPSSSIVYYLLYCYCNGIEWHWCPKWLLPLNVALTDIGAVLMTATPLQTRPCAYKL